MTYRYMYMATPEYKNPFPGGHEIHNFGTAFFSHHFYILDLSNICPGVEKKLIKEINIYYTKLSILGVEGHEIYNFLSP